MTTLAEALAPRSDQLNADDLIPGPRTLTITDARITKNDRQTRVSLNYEGDNGKPFKPCKTMGRAMVLVWGITDEKQMIGKSITVYRDPDVKFGDQGAIGGIRISHMSGIDSPQSVKLTVSQGKKANFTFQPLSNAGQSQDDEGAGDLAADLIRRIEDADSLDALHAFVAREAIIKRRAWLQEKSRVLYDKVGEAFVARETALTERAREGRADDQHGDQHDSDTDEAPAWQGAVDAHLAHIAAAELLADVRIAIDDFAASRDALPDEARADVESAEHNRMMSFSPATGG